MIDCGSANCTNEAAVLAMWPGQHLPMCPACLGRAGRIAEVLGFELPAGSLVSLVAERAAEVENALRGGGKDSDVNI